MKKTPGEGHANAQGLEAAPRAGDEEHYELMLFVSGTTPNSVRAIANTRRMCDEYLPGRHTLTVVDLYQQPELARSEQIIAAPTLVRKQPLPVRRLVGSLVDATAVLLPQRPPRAPRR